MNLKKMTAGVATAGLLGLGGLGVAAGLAQADPPSPRPDNPGNSDNPGNAGGNGNPGNAGGNGNPGPRPDTVTGPGVNAGDPGTPLPPGLGYLPPPGQGGPMPQDVILLPEVPAWVTTPVLPPEDAPAQPELPEWAVGLPIVWNPDLAVWGVWNEDTGIFVQL
ncbi:hypothetical protein [Mycolicibacterium austroafricanum]|uniref:hypothetical protein n=1 Tax=Mycolicibacterium austroafricanum TaxID=39687 RepID=UPI001CA357A6|nr:hypothetical protein [Mycolicibacterium austroafricanum]QZT65134.1 hypothetical protein JN085_12905 [Mycolicibacterium austroafricanum]